MTVESAERRSDKPTSRVESPEEREDGEQPHAPFRVCEAKGLLDVVGNTDDKPEDGEGAQDNPDRSEMAILAQQEEDAAGEKDSCDDERKRNHEQKGPPITVGSRHGTTDRIK